MNEPKKTPGQVAFEAYGSPLCLWGDLFEVERARWERTANAVLTLASPNVSSIGIGSPPPPPPPPPG